ncbi:TATA-binding protein-associated factor mot1, partial [Ceratobasidium sp. 428]
MQRHTFGDLLLHFIQSTSAYQRFIASTIVQEWALAQSTPTLTQASPLASECSTHLLTFLEQDCPSSYHEMGAHLRSLALDCRALLQSFADDARVPASKLPTLPDRIDPEGKQDDAFTFAFAQKFVGETFDSLKASIPRGRKKELGGLEEKRGRIRFGLDRYGVVKGQLD